MTTMVDFVDAPNSNGIVMQSQRHLNIDTVDSNNSVLDIEQTVSATQLSTTNVTFVMVSLCFSVMLSALDLTVVTPAIPAIVADFRSVNGYIWVGSAFILAYTAVTTMWGSVSNIWGRKPIILAALVIFLAGSLLCALAPTMNALIVGRIVQGLGSSGVSVLVNIVIADLFSLRDRGLYLAITSLVWAVGSAVGPVIGGAFTTKVNWRWCFWINLPVGGVVFIILVCFMKLHTPHTPVWKGLKSIDWIGSLLIIGGALMFLLGLDLGGEAFPWNSATVICTIVFGIVTIGMFLLNEWKFVRDPVIPLGLFSTGTRAAAYGVLACNSFVFIGLAYYLPLYAQSVLGSTALVSGLELLPLIVASSLAAAFAGVFIQRTGIYRPLMYVAQVFLLLGTGLFITLKPEQDLTKLFVFEVLTGIGVGLNIEGPILAAQAASPVRDTAAVTATMAFVRSVATAISVVIGGVVFQNRMMDSNADLQTRIGSESAALFNGDIAAANIAMISTLPVDYQRTVRLTYFSALRTVWIMCSGQTINGWKASLLPYVAFAGLATVLNFFVGTFHLSREHQGAVLGADRSNEVTELQEAE